jgi:NADH-quinone oxidoreductase subunit C
MHPTALIATLQSAVADATFEPAASTDQPTIYVPLDRILDTCRILATAAQLRYEFLADLTAVDWWPREPRFEVVYHLASIAHEQRLRLKVRVPADTSVPTVSTVWPAADWDLFGIPFEGHPDLRRLLMPDDWEGHPLRKDYPVQIKLLPKTAEPLQVTAEEFRANIEHDRLRRGN